MRKTALCAALVATGALGQGCATVRVGAVAGEAAAQVDAAMVSPSQAKLRVSSKEFTDHAVAVGWAEPGGGGEVRQALDVLIHGREKAAPAAEPALRPAAAFIRVRGYDGVEPARIAAALQSEIRSARAGVRAVNAAATVVVLGSERTPWSRRDDVAAAESVLRAAYRSRVVFHDVRDAVADRLGASGRTNVDEELAAFDLELQRLSKAADALSLTRPEVRLEQVRAIEADADIG